MGERRTSLRLLHFWAIAAVLLARGCSHDWDTYDPRLEGSSSGGGGHGGAGTTATNSSSVSSGMTSSSASSGMGGGGGGTLCMPDISQPCYDGPAGTEMNPPCKGGVHICAPDGMSWGPCLTQVTPVIEECTSAADDDCNGAANDHCGLWSKRFGDASNQQPYAMAVSADGHIVITGSTEGMVNFGGGLLPATGGGDLFVAVFDANGTHVWGKVFGDPAFQVGYGVAIDGAGNVYVTGSFSGVLSFGAAPGLTLGDPTVVDDMFIAKLDPVGNPLWARSFGDPTYQEGLALAADAAGNVYLGGYFEGTVDFGAGPKTATSGNGVLIKFDPTGSVLFSYTFGAGGNDWAGAIAIAPSGDIVVSGGFGFKAIFGATTLTSLGQTDAFVAKLTAAGVPIWAHGYGSAADEVPGGVATDSAGNVLFNGLFGAAIDFGCGSVPAAGMADMFIAKLDSSGQCLFSHGYGDPTDVSKNPYLAADGAGNALVTFEFAGATDFGGGPISTASPNDIVVVKLDPSGKHLFTRQFGKPSGDQDGRGIGVDAAGNVYVLGELTGSVNFGTGTLSGMGGDDIVLAKLAP